MISDADAVRWAVRVMPQLAAKADGRPDELGQQYLDRLTALADRLDGGVIVPREPSADFAAWLQREMPAGTVIGDPGWWVPRIYRAMLDASEAK